MILPHFGLHFGTFFVSFSTSIFGAEKGGAMFRIVRGLAESALPGRQSLDSNLVSERRWPVPEARGGGLKSLGGSRKPNQISGSFAEQAVKYR